MMRRRQTASASSPHLNALALICLFCSIATAPAQDRGDSNLSEQQFFPSLDQAAEMERAWRQLTEMRPLRDAATRESLRSLKSLQTHRLKGDFWMPSEYNRMR
jgi:hypothetical protein